MKYFVQYFPTFCEGFDRITFNFETDEELFGSEFCKGWREQDLNNRLFDRFTLKPYYPTKDDGCYILEAHYKYLHETGEERRSLVAGMAYTPKSDRFKKVDGVVIKKADY